MNSQALNLQKNAFRRFGGFTLIELMVTIAVMGILASIAIPSFIKLMASNRMTNEINAVVAGLNFARSEAVKRGEAVFVCPATSPTTATAACTSTTNWSSGWIVLDTSNAPPPLQISNGVSSGDTLQSTTTSGVRFNQMGYTSNTDTITVHDRNSTQGIYRCIIFSAGSWTIGKGATCP